MDWTSQLDIAVSGGPSKEAFHSVWELLDTEDRSDDIHTAVEHARQLMESWPHGVCQPPKPESFGAHKPDVYWSIEASKKLRWALVRSFYPYGVRSLGLQSMQYLETALKVAPLEGLHLNHQPFDASGAKRFVQQSLPHLRELSVVGCKLTPAKITKMLANLASGGELASLRLAYNSVTDKQVEQMSQLSHLQNLRVLQLDSTKVTDGAVDALSTMSTLRELDLARTKVTGDGVARLVNALPDLEKLNIEGITITIAAAKALKGFELVQEERRSAYGPRSAYLRQAVSAAAPDVPVSNPSDSPLPARLLEILHGEPGEERWADLWEWFAVERPASELTEAETRLKEWPDQLRRPLLAEGVPEEGNYWLEEANKPRWRLIRCFVASDLFGEDIRKIGNYAVGRLLPTLASCLSEAPVTYCDLSGLNCYRELPKFLGAKLPALKHLALVNCSLDGKDIRALVNRADFVGTLSHLALSGRDLKKADMLAIVSAPGLKDLKELVLRRQFSPASASVVKAFLTAKPELRLEVLDLTHCSFGKNAALFSGLPMQQSLKVLHLYNRGSHPAIIQGVWATLPDLEHFTLNGEPVERET